VAYLVPDRALLQLQFEGRLFGQQVMTVMTYRMTPGFDEEGPNLITEVEGLVKAAGGLFEKWTDCLSEDVVDITRTYQWIKPTRYAFETFVDDPVATGGIALPALPPNESQAVTRRAFLAGRKMTSTLKLPGLPIDKVVGGFLVDDQLTRLGIFGTKSCEIINLVSGATLYPTPFGGAGWDETETLTLNYAHNTSRVMRRRTVRLGN